MQFVLLLTLEQLLQKLYDLPSHRLQAFMQLVVIQSLYSELEQYPPSFQLLHCKSPPTWALKQPSFENKSYSKGAVPYTVITLSGLKTTLKTFFQMSKIHS